MPKHTIRNILLLFLCAAALSSGCVKKDADSTASSGPSKTTDTSKKKDKEKDNKKDKEKENEEVQTPAEEESPKAEENSQSELPSASAEQPAPVTPSDQVTVDYDGVMYSVRGIPIINKKYPISPDYYGGEDPTAYAALCDLINFMQSQGMDVSSSYSGFRTYEYQSNLYNNYVAANGQALADTFSARPGHSEHESGLAFDLLNTNGQLLTTDYEAGWLMDHAADYGFIVRYQEGKEGITGYMAEPWHLRYIGEEARAIMDSGLTLEEYLGVEGGDYN